MKKPLSIFLTAAMCATMLSGCKYRIVLEEVEEAPAETTVTVSVTESETTAVTEETTTVTTTAETTTTAPETTKKKKTVTRKKPAKPGEFSNVKLEDKYGNYMRLEWDRVKAAVDYTISISSDKYTDKGNVFTETTDEEYIILDYEIFDNDVLYIRMIAQNDGGTSSADFYCDTTGGKTVLTSASGEINAEVAERTEKVTTAATKAVTTAAAEKVTSKNTIPTITEEIYYRTIIKYNHGVKNLKLGSNKSYTLYDFSNVKETGVGRDGTVHPARMCYGVSAEVKDKTVYFNSYNDYPNEIKATVESIKFLSDESTKDIKVTDETMSIDCSELKNGPYIIQTAFSTGKKPSIMIYVNDGDVYLCSFEAMTNSDYEKFTARREKIYDLMDLYNVKTTNTVDTSNLCYPWNDRLGKNSDTKKWIALSNEIVEKDWSKSRKVFAFHEWMCENLAYDFYKVNVLHNTRAFYYEIFDGSLDIYTTRVGVCVDYANIFVTMCRAHDIPCITMETPGHTWNLVYINGVWIEIDMTMDVKNGVYGKDLTKWERPESPYCYDGYFDEFVNGGTAETLLDTLWDYDILEFNKKVSATGGHDVDSVRLPD